MEKALYPYLICYLELEHLLLIALRIFLYISLLSRLEFKLRHLKAESMA